jgi:hypothetical protein
MLKEHFHGHSVPFLLPVRTVPSRASRRGRRLRRRRTGHHCLGSHTHHERVSDAPSPPWPGGLKVGLGCRNLLVAAKAATVSWWHRKPELVVLGFGWLGFEGMGILVVDAFAYRCRRPRQSRRGLAAFWAEKASAYRSVGVVSRTGFWIG